MPSTSLVSPTPSSSRTSTHDPTHATVATMRHFTGYAHYLWCSSLIPPGISSFKEYYDTVPPPPDFIVPINAEFPYRVLVEPRLPLRKTVATLHAEYSGLDFDPVPLHAMPYWIRCAV